MIGIATSGRAMGVEHMKPAVLALVLACPVLSHADEIVAPEQGFSVTFPGPTQMERAPRAAGLVEGLRWSAQSGGVSYVLSLAHWETMASQEDPMLETMQKDGFATFSKQGFAVVSDRFVGLEGRPGREGLLERGDGVMLRTLLFVSARTRRGYALAVTAPKARLDDAAVRAFFDSFHFLEPITSERFVPPARSSSLTFPAAAEMQAGDGVTTWRASHEGMIYAVQLMPFSAFEDSERRLDRVRDSIVEGKVLSETRLTVNGRPARDVRVDSGKPATVSYRFILDPGAQELYVLSVMGVKPRMAESKISSFFDSFRFAEGLGLPAATAPETGALAAQVQSLDQGISRLEGDLKAQAIVLSTAAVAHKRDEINRLRKARENLLAELAAACQPKTSRGCETLKTPR